MTTDYTVGFAFSEDRKHLAVILKNRPAWQAGKHNGIGGHMEPGEIPNDCQAREFAEETGAYIPPDTWEIFAVLTGKGYKVHCYRAFTDEIYKVQRDKTNEGQVYVVATHQITDGGLPIIPNLSYLVPLALDDDQRGVPYFDYTPAG